MLAFDSVAVLQSLCFVTLTLIMLDVDEENIFQNNSLCCFIVPFVFPFFFFFFPHTGSFFELMQGIVLLLIIFRKKSMSQGSVERRAAPLDLISSEFRRAGSE